MVLCSDVFACLCEGAGRVRLYETGVDEHGWVSNVLGEHVWWVRNVFLCMCWVSTCVAIPYMSGEQVCLCICWVSTCVTIPYMSGERVFLCACWASG